MRAKAAGAERPGQNPPKRPKPFRRASCPLRRSPPDAKSPGASVVGQTLRERSRSSSPRSLRRSHRAAGEHLMDDVNTAGLESQRRAVVTARTTRNAFPLLLQRPGTRSTRGLRQLSALIACPGRNPFSAAVRELERCWRDSVSPVSPPFGSPHDSPVTQPTNNPT